MPMRAVRFVPIEANRASRRCYSFVSVAQITTRRLRRRRRRPPIHGTNDKTVGHRQRKVAGRTCSDCCGRRSQEHCDDTSRETHCAAEENCLFQYFDRCCCPRGGCSLHNVEGLFFVDGVGRRHALLTPCRRHPPSSPNRKKTTIVDEKERAFPERGENVRPRPVISRHVIPRSYFIESTIVQSQLHCSCTL